MSDAGAVTNPPGPGAYEPPARLVAWAKTITYRAFSLSLSLCLSLSLYIYIYIYTNTYTQVYIYIYIYMYICNIYIHIHMCVHICIYIYIYIYSVRQVMQETVQLDLHKFPSGINCGMSWSTNRKQLIQILDMRTLLGWLRLGWLKRHLLP